MKHSALGLVALVLLGLLGLTYGLLRHDPATGERGGDPEAAARLQGLEAKVLELERKLAALEARPDPVLADRLLPAPEAKESARSGEAGQPRDARWYLEQYVRSFDDGGEGSEYFRLLVDAYALELLAPICALAREPGRPPGLRLAMVRMLAKARLRGDATALTALVDILRQNAADNLANACLQSWSKLAGPGHAPMLEEIVWQLQSLSVRRNALRALLQVSGAHANGTILRLLGTAPDDAAAQLLIGLLDGADLEAALAVFRAAAQRNQPVRLTGAHRIGEFDGEEFKNFVEDWLRVETDQEVIRALGGARNKQKSLQNWSAMQAAGPPNATPTQDDPKAWAPRDAEMGLQWLELQYQAADRCTGVRIFEVCAPGAVAEIKAKDAAGTWHTLWSGRTAATGRGPLELSWPATAFATQTLRLVLDTDRTPGWNEIDAVELIGAGTRQFAARATASSSYAQQVAAFGNEQLEFTPRIRR